MNQFLIAVVKALMMATSKVSIPKHLYMEIQNRGFVHKRKYMDLGGSNLTQLSRVGLQHEIRVWTKISNIFETTNFHLYFHANEDESKKYETWILSVAQQIEHVKGHFPK